MGSPLTVSLTPQSLRILATVVSEST